MAENDQSPAAKLTTLLGFNAARKSLPVTQEIFKEVLSEVTDERRKAAKGQVKELLTKAMDLHSQAAVAEKKFNQEKAKFEKELGKLINQIQSLIAGKEPEETTDQPAEAAV